MDCLDWGSSLISFLDSGMVHVTALCVLPALLRFVPPELELQEIAERGLAGHEPASPHFPKKHAEATEKD